MSETTDCAKRAVRIKALRAKAASTEYPEERETFNAKADELQAKNDSLGYVDPGERSSRSAIFGAAFDDFMRPYQEAASAEHLRRYQAWLRQQEARKNDAPCSHRWRVIFSAESYRLVNYCVKCGKEDTLLTDTGNVRDDAPGPKTGAKRRPTSERRPRVDHSECYANGWHDKSKAGRASCRRGTV